MTGGIINWERINVIHHGYLLENPDSAKVYNDDMFHMVGKALSSFQSSSFSIDIHTNEKAAIVVLVLLGVRSHPQASTHA